MARTKEQRSWDTFSKAIDPKSLKCIRIENLYSDGIPDVIVQNRRGATIWIENKALDCWPVRATTKPLRTAFEAGQLAFGRDWINWGGHAFVLLRVGLDYFLLDPACDLKDLTRDEIETGAVSVGKQEIIGYLESR